MKIEKTEKNEIAILDFGSQYTHLIARRIRELGIKSCIYPNDIKTTDLKNAAGIILSGGPKNLAKEEKLNFDANIFELEIPVLGLCYGHQLMADFFGGTVESGQSREYGIAQMNIYKSPIFENVNKKTTVWMSHGVYVSKLPKGFKKIASTHNKSIAAMENSLKKIYGFQFHPEVYHSRQGMMMLYNFIFNICKAKQNWTADKMLEEIKKEIKKQAQNKNIFLLISGGVDSTVSFALLKKVLGRKKVYGLHVDHGLMRTNESELVRASLAKIGLDDLHVYNAEKEYLEKLKGIVDPEQKRKIIGNLFLDITDKIMKKKKMTKKKWLVGQGTIYPDTIESGGTKNADVIKTHHNRVPRIEQIILEGRIIEPIRELYKDEVREIGLKLGLPRELVMRRPFPGPGLGIRCLCSDGSDEKIKKIGQDIWQLPIKSVGVQGDERSYAHPALITNTLQEEKRDWKLLRLISPRITNENKDINRVLFLLHGEAKKLKDSRVKKAFVNKTRLNLLRKIDAIVNKNIFNNPSCSHIWQMPVVLVPFGYGTQESIVLRPVESQEAMTVSFAQIPKTTLYNITEEIKKLNKIDYIFYDITNKPPGTIEWE